jgi:carboxypeptidase D
VCEGRSDLFLHKNHSIPSALGPLPSVVKRTNNTIISHGLLEFLLFENFFVPYHQSLGCILEIANAAIPNTPPQTDTAGGGYQDVMHIKRGPALVTLALAGNEIVLYVPELLTTNWNSSWGGLIVWNRWATTRLRRAISQVY